MAKGTGENEEEQEKLKVKVKVMVMVSRKKKERVKGRTLKHTADSGVFRIVGSSLGMRKQGNAAGKVELNRSSGYCLGLIV